MLPLFYSHCKTISVGQNDYQINSIKKALELAADGDSILIYDGIYREGNIIINKELTVLGINWPVLDGENKFENITVTSRNVTISGLKLTNSGVSFIEDNAAVKLNKVSNCTISNNIFEKNFFAIYLAQSSNCLITENKISSIVRSESSSGNGIHLWYSRDIIISNNNISGHRDGIYLEFVRHSYIRDNLSENNLRYGLHFMFSDSCKYSQNKFIQNGAGVAVMYTRNVIMEKNEFLRNWGGASYGILLKDISDSDIKDNRFYKNSSGIYIEGSNRVHISRNNFVENGWAIRLMANSMDNDFYENNFIGNSFDVSTNSVKNYNEFNNNFWSDYIGYDLNKDGIGDIPYRPVKLFSLIVEKNRPTLILLRSMMIDLLDLAERVFPVLTPETLLDNSPRMKIIL